MESISTPQKVHYTPTLDNPYKSTLTIEPCFPGYGSTIGNALRRVLLSSLSGAAVTGFKIKGVHHEFSTIAGVKEDIIELMMNLKGLRFRVFSDEPVRMELFSEGQKCVTAGDIIENAQVEVLNKDHLIATLTKRDAKLDMELVVERGQGFVTSETREVENAEVGLIAIDAIFNPVRAVGYKIENVRVGKMTNYERLIIDIETDGSILPEEAVNRAVSIIQEQMRAVSTDTNIMSKYSLPLNTKETHDDEGSISTDNGTGGDDTKKKKRAGRPKKVMHN